MNYPDNRAKLEFPAKVGKSCKVNLRMHEITPKTDANVEVSPNFRCPGGHCLGLCRPLGPNDGGIGSSWSSITSHPARSFILGLIF